MMMIVIFLCCFLLIGNSIIITIPIIAHAAPTETDLYKLKTGTWANEIEFYMMQIQFSLYNEVLNK
jgi:hypothetical protein